jgi:hypothetical protein
MITVTIDGANQEWPEENEPEFTWALPTDTTIQAIATALGIRVKTTTNQSIAGDKTFTDKIIATIIQSVTANPGASGLMRLSKTDLIVWRNNANSGDLALTIDGSDNLTFNGSSFATDSSVSKYILSTPGVAVTLVYTDSRRQRFTPSASIDLNLPTTSILAGETFDFINSSPTFSMTMKSSNGDTICTILPKNRVSVSSTQATPTTGSHWVQTFGGGGFSSWTPSFTNMAPTSVYSKCSRDGEWLIGEVKFIGGGGAASEGRLGLPSGLTTSSQYPTTTYNTNIVGDAIIDLSGAEAIYFLAEASKSYLTFGLQNGANSGVSSINGNILDPYTLTGNFRVRIDNWNID